VKRRGVAKARNPLTAATTAEAIFYKRSQGVYRGKSVLSMARPEQPSIPHHELSKADVVAPIIETSANKKRRKHIIKDGKTKISNSPWIRG